MNVGLPKGAEPRTHWDRGRARLSLQMKQLPAFWAVVVRPLHPINREQDATVGAINALGDGF